MKAILKNAPREGVVMEEVPMPKFGDNDLLIKTIKTSICGTDVHLYLWDEWARKTLPVPSIIGHEFVGRIVDMGKNVKGFKVGDRVSGEGHITCGQCRMCRTGRRVLCPKTIGVGVNRDGCFAEYLAIPAENAFPVPETIPDEVASVFDPLGNAVHTALSFDLVGQDVLITGAGPIGLMTIPIAKKSGARNVVISDVNPYRLALAKKMGATRAVNVQEESLEGVMKTLGIDDGFDVCLEMSGNPQAFASLPDLCSHGAYLVLLGILPTHATLDWHQVIFKMLTIKGIYGREIFRTWYQVAALLQSGLDVTPVITHRFPAEEFQKGFDAMLSGSSGKVILDWSHL
ncbi:MAG: L-threonine 3-dehydrogenase [Chlamydiales bacterium]|nr:L-threonine 3-dehydrogenase [Chlamydiales bacterium]